MKKKIDSSTKNKRICRQWVVLIDLNQLLTRLPLFVFFLLFYSSTKLDTDRIVIIVINTVEPKMKKKTNKSLPTNLFYTTLLPNPWPKIEKLPR